RIAGLGAWRRRFLLAADAIRVVDVIEGEGSHRVESFFHFHPAVALVRNADEVMLDGPGASVHLRWMCPQLQSVEAFRMGVLEDGSVVVVFNGEIYNYIELREQLEARGHRFRTKSDGEVIAHLYEDRDVDALCNLNGMFGLCLWDRARQRGVLARDPLGIKPLYYWSDGQRCLFASELKALLPHLPNVAVDWEAIDAYLQHMFVPAPRSPISGVRKLPPGCFLEFSTAGVGKPRPFWDVRQLPDEVLAAPK